MQALAELLHDRGWELTACDADPDAKAVARFASLNIPLAGWHSLDHLGPRPDVVIHSPALPATHPELQAARETGVRVLDYVDALGELSRTIPTIAVAGTHGKSTTTAWLATILQSAGLQPGLLCGAELKEHNRSGWCGAGKWLVLEACEYRRHFLRLRPQIICLTGIEPDHFDCYATLEDACAAYATFVALLPPDGTLVFNRDCPRASAIAAAHKGQSLSWSASGQAADWSAPSSPSLEGRGPGGGFSVPGQTPIFSSSETFNLRLPGVHNLSNALGAATTASACGLSIEQILPGVNQFTGLRRRFEILRDDAELTLIDDYAHHPTEIRATLLAARERFPNRPLWCVFQPHQISRTRALFNEFQQSLELADQVWLLPVFAAREQVTGERESLVGELAERIGTRARVIDSLDRVWSNVQTGGGLRPVVLTMGAGSIARIHQ